ncbi:HAD family hydrolase [Dinoroseobacter sp. PD6]|uniref:sulfotransferase-like domain-containing protein n=1 Tax=Dinoroseobacter sp. PD6 TaxID=3028384 RepID=UPI00237A5D8F|nr:HAD family hydrolase [Dinoroseobacter sp. PD6]MDD9718079.1 HAD family hydrolase [Dinoroseobacter sp. PD6]
MRIAMWSGPRNLSTAMMYSFGARGDCAVWDEPFYAAYLDRTGADHPMAAEIVAAHEADPERVAARCCGPIPGGKAHFYMKHMPHHMLPDFPLDWAEPCMNIHLIRHPARVIASYGAKREEMTLADIGFPQQAALFDRLGGLVVDSADIRADPAGMLGLLCAEIALPFDPGMLRWSAGGRPEDGVWARHWYGAVHRSTGFAGPEGPLPDVPDGYQSLYKAAMETYSEMQARKLVLPKA